MRWWPTAMVTMAAMLASGAALAQAFPIMLVQFEGGPTQTVQLRGDKAVAYAADDKPLLKGTRAFVLGFAGNTAGQVFAWDVRRQKVRVSREGRPAVWLACAELQGMSIACNATVRVTSDGALVIGGGGDHSVRGADPLSADPATLSRLPDCPGDPRCP